jgi:ABC-type multidrug transport system ATPase subunit/ABC-type multidrug transport system permease subunit
VRARDEFDLVCCKSRSSPLGWAVRIDDDLSRWRPVDQSHHCVMAVSSRPRHSAQPGFGLEVTLDRAGGRPASRVELTGAVLITGRQAPQLLWTIHSAIRSQSGRLKWLQACPSAYSGASAAMLSRETLTVRAVAPESTNLQSIFVPNNDAHLSRLTVGDTVSFAAHQLGRLQEDRSAVQSMLALDNCDRVPVGSADQSGASGGQRRRLTLAEGLLARGNVLCLDRVTSGLDAAIAISVVQGVQQRAREQGQLLLIALDQPGPELVALFPTVLVVHQWASVFCGPHAGLRAGAAALGLQLAPDDDALPGLLAALEARGVEQVGGGAASGCKEAGSGALQLGTGSEGGRVRGVCSPLHIRVDGTDDVKPAALPAAKHEECTAELAPSWLAKTARLIKRQAVLTYGNHAWLGGRLAFALAMGVLLGCMFRSPALLDFPLKLSVVTFSLFVLACANLADVPAVCELKAVAGRQIESGLYPPSALACALTVVPLPLHLVEVVLLVLPLYKLVGFAPSGSCFAFFLLMFWLANMTLALLFRSVALLCRTPQSALSVSAPLAGALLLFTGFLVTPGNIHPWLIWLFWLNPAAYVFRSVALSEFLASSGQYSGNLPSFGPSAGTPMTWGQLFLQTYDLPTSDALQWPGAGFLIACVVLLLALSSWAVQRLQRGYHRDLREAAATDGLSIQRTPWLVRVWQHCALTRQTIKASTASVTTNEIKLHTGAEPASAISSLKRVYASRLSSANGHPCGLQAHAESAADPPAAAQDQNSVAGAVVEPARAGSRRCSGLAFKDITVTVDARTAACTPSVAACWPALACFASRHAATAAAVPLLQGVCGVLQPGQLTAIMGESGAGKTTLISVLAGHSNSGRVQGTITLEGRPCDAAQLATRCAYVQQDDALPPHATVYECVFMACALKAPASVFNSSAPGSSNSNGRPAFVRAVLAAVGLEPDMHRAIGERGSPGALPLAARKLVALAAAVAGVPTVLIADEVTTGLGAAEAMRVVAVLRALADLGVVVAVSIHQPSAALLSSFDALLLLQRGGRIAYAGAVGARGSAVADYFTEYARAPPGRPLPAEAAPARVAGDSDTPHVSPSPGASAGLEALPLQPAAEPTRMLDVLGSAGGTGLAVVHAPVTSCAITPHAIGIPCATVPTPRVGADANPATWTLQLLRQQEAAVDFAAAFSASRCGHLWAQQVEDSFGVHQADSRASPASVAVRLDHLGTGFCLLVRREWLALWRDPSYVWSRMAAALALAVLFGALYWRLDMGTTGGTQSAVGAFFTTLVFIGLLNFAAAIPRAVGARVLVHRESSAGMYPKHAYVAAWVVAELPAIIITSLLYSAVFLPMLGPVASGAGFVNYWLNAALLSVVYLALGIGLAGLFASTQTALAYGFALQSLMFIFGGLFAPENRVPAGLRWLLKINPLCYVVQSVWTQQFYCAAAASSSSTCPTFAVGGVGLRLSQWEFLRDILGLRAGVMQWSYPGITAAFAVGLVAVAMLIHARLTHVRS